MERYLAAADAVLKEAKYPTVIIAEAGEKLPRRDAARRVIEHWAFRAFRRPVADEEIEPYLKLLRHRAIAGFLLRLDQARPQGDARLAALPVPHRAGPRRDNEPWPVERLRAGQPAVLLPLVLDAGPTAL